MKVLIRRVVFVLSLFGLWELVYRFNTIYEFRSVTVFPSPFGVLEQLYIGFFDSMILLNALQMSFQRIILGFFLAVIIGGVLGVLIGRLKTMDDTLGSLVVALQTIPSIVWLPIAMLAFKDSNAAIIFVVTLGGTWAMTLNTRMGTKNVDPLLLRAGQTMGYHGLELVGKIIIPAAIPSILTGMRLAWAFGWRALMAAELLGSIGLGRTLMDAKDFFNFDLVIAIMVIISTIGLLVEHVFFKTVERKVMIRYGLSS